MRGRKKTYLTDAERAQARREANLRWWKRHRLGLTDAGIKASGRIAPDEVIEERERAFAGQRDLTALLLGDPLPSRSALARKCEELA